MPLIILHDLNSEEVVVNTDAVTAAKRKIPDDKSQIKEPYTKLYFVAKDKGMDAMGFPDTVTETPAEIAAMSRKPG